MKHLLDLAPQHLEPIYPALQAWLLDVLSEASRTGVKCLDFTVTAKEVQATSTQPPLGFCFQQPGNPTKCLFDHTQRPVVLEEHLVHQQHHLPFEITVNGKTLPKAWKLAFTLNTGEAWITDQLQHSSIITQHRVLFGRKFQLALEKIRLDFPKNIQVLLSLYSTLSVHLHNDQFTWDPKDPLELEATEGNLNLLKGMLKELGDTLTAFGQQIMETHPHTRFEDLPLGDHPHLQASLLEPTVKTHHLHHTVGCSFEFDREDRSWCLASHTSRYSTLNPIQVQDPDVANRINQMHHRKTFPVPATQERNGKALTVEPPIPETQPPLVHFAQTLKVGQVKLQHVVLGRCIAGSTRPCLVTTQTPEALVQHLLTHPHDLEDLMASVAPYLINAFLVSPPTGDGKATRVYLHQILAEVVGSVRPDLREQVEKRLPVVAMLEALPDVQMPEGTDIPQGLQRLMENHQKHLRKVREELSMTDAPLTNNT